MPLLLIELFLINFYQNNLLTNPPFLPIIILGMFSHTSVIRQAGDLKYAQI
jgi:hypothetical protein